MTVDGQPVGDGSISLIPSGGTIGPSSGGKIADGFYAIERKLGPAVGTYRVEILAVRKTGRKVEAGPPSPPGTMIDETEQYVPPSITTRAP